MFRFVLRLLLTVLVLSYVGPRFLGTHFSGSLITAFAVAATLCTVSWLVIKTGEAALDRHDCYMEPLAALILGYGTTTACLLLFLNQIAASRLHFDTPGSMAITYALLMAINFLVNSDVYVKFDLAIHFPIGQTQFCFDRSVRVVKVVR